MSADAPERKKAPASRPDGHADAPAEREAGTGRGAAAEEAAEARAPSLRTRGLRGASLSIGQQAARPGRGSDHVGGSASEALIIARRDRGRRCGTAPQGGAAVRSEVQLRGTARASEPVRCGRPPRSLPVLLLSSRSV